MKKLIFSVSLVLLFSFGFAFQNQTAMDRSEAIRKVDGEWMKSVQSKDIVKILSFYRDDADWLLRGTPPIRGKEGIKKNWSGFFAMPDAWIQWDPTTVGVSISGDLGYSEGTYEMKYSDKQGKTLIQKGAYVAIWKKDENGVWKLAVDISN